MRLCNLDLTRAEPGIACIFGPPLTEDGQTVKTRKRGNSGKQKYGETKKHRSSANRRHMSVLTFILSPWLGLHNRPTVPPLNIAIIPWR